MSDFGTLAAGAALDLASGLFNTGTQFVTSKKLMDYQNQLNIQNWKMANEYNSPKAQMERYKAAGLNPNLVYGSLGQTAAGNLSSPSSNGINPRTQLGGSAASFLIAAAQAKNMKLQNSNIEEQNNQIRANIAKTNAETRNIEENTNQLIEFKQLRKDALNYANTMAKLGVDRETAESNYYEANAYLRNALLNNQRILQADKHAINAVEIIQRKAETNKTIAQTSLIAAQIVLSRVQASYYESATELNYHKVTLTDKQTRLLGEQIAYWSERVRTAPHERKAIELKNASQAIENYIYATWGKKEAQWKVGPIDLGTIVYGVSTAAEGQGYNLPNIYSTTPNIE
ncbi:DNA pilot protein [Microvirus sp.]|nr:DNA pilot protein [Microvirus sp.]